MTRCQNCGKRTRPEWGESKYQVEDGGALGRFVRFPCDNCGAPVRDYESWHREERQEDEVAGLPQWFWYACAALALVLLFMLAMSKGGY